MRFMTASDLVVLVVEDHPSMRKIIKTVLLQMSVHAVLEAADGVEALEHLRARNRNIPVEMVDVNPELVVTPLINMIICDWMMPKMSGIEVLRTVRADPRWQDIPFIMLTAETERDKVVSALEKGVTDYISKPFTPALLEAKIFQVLRYKNA